MGPFNYQAALQEVARVLSILVILIPLVAVLRWPPTGGKKMIAFGLLLLIVGFASSVLMSYAFNWFLQNSSGQNVDQETIFEIYRSVSLGLQQAALLGWILIGIGLWQLRKPLNLVDRLREEGDERIDF